jgi:hypothetical protein
VGSQESLKKDVRRQIEAVEDVLRQWDPIGVFPCSVGGPRDEYDGYAPELLHALRAGDSVAELARQLSAIRTKLMCLPENSTADLRAARQLHSWWQAQHSDEVGAP